MELIVNPQPADWSTLFKRPTQSFDAIEASVTQVFDEVQRHGDKAVRKYTALFDNVKIDSFKVSEEEMAGNTMMASDFGRPSNT